MRPPIKSYKDLEVWQKGVELAVDLYSVTRRFPSSERFGMASQIQRAGVSIPANIAEGHAKTGPGHYLNHLSHSRGSLSELETLLLIANRVGFVSPDMFRQLCGRTDEIGKMLRSLANSVARSNASGAPYDRQDPRPRT